MISNTTVVFYKDLYDIIYIVDKIDYVNARDVEYTTTVLDPNIYGSAPIAKVQDGVVFKYGKIDIRKEVFSLAGGMGVFKDVADPYTFTADEPYFISSNVGRQVTIRNVVRSADGTHTLYIYNAVIERVINSQMITINRVFNNTIVPPHIGAALVSLEPGYRLSDNIIPSHYVSYDFIRMTYECNDGAVQCGSRAVPDVNFRFGPTDTFKFHLDSQPVDSVDSYVSDGYRWVDVDDSSCAWAPVDDFGNASAQEAVACFGGDGVFCEDPSEIIGYSNNVVTWVDVWGNSQ